MKKRFIGILLSICICATFFTGCSLYRSNGGAIADEVAIKVGDEVIYKNDLKSAYNYYYQNSQYSSLYRYYVSDEQEFADMITDMYVKNKVAYLEAKELVVVTEEDYDWVVDSVREVVLSNIDSRETEIIGKNGEPIPERLCSGENCTDETHNHEKNETATAFDKFESSEVSPTVNGESISDAKKEEKVNSLIEAIKENCNEFETRKAAFAEYIAELVQTDLVYGKETNRDLALKNKVQELVNNYLEQKYIENLQDYLFSRIEITEDEVVSKYKDLIAEAKQKYADGSFVETYEGATNETYLYMDYEGDGYFHVQHILLQFGDDVKTSLDGKDGVSGYGLGNGYGTDEEIKEYRYLRGLEWLEGDDHTKENAPAICWFPEEDDDISGYMTLAEYKMYTKTRATYVQTIESEYKDLNGNKLKDEDGTAKTIVPENGEDGILDLVKAIAANSDLTDAQKAERFRELRYQYGTDSGNETYDKFGYVFTADINDFWDSSLSTKGSAGEFVEEAYRLYAEMQDKNVAIATSYIVTDFGIHIMMAYDKTKTGEICAANADAMKSTTISTVYGQDVYDYVYSILLDEKKVETWNNFIASAKDKYKIEYKISGYEDLTK